MPSPWWHHVNSSVRKGRGKREDILYTLRYIWSLASEALLIPLCKKYSLVPLVQESGGFMGIEELRETPQPPWKSLKRWHWLHQQSSPRGNGGVQSVFCSVEGCKAAQRLSLNGEDLCLRIALLSVLHTFTPRMHAATAYHIFTLLISLSCTFSTDGL